MRKTWVWLVFVLFAACSPASNGTTTTTLMPQSPMGSDAKVILLHHSTGYCIWQGGVPEYFDSYDSANGVNYAIDELAYPDSPYPWDNYPYDYWHLWVDGGSGQAAAEGVPTLESFISNYDVIVFKHCFPVSEVGPDGTPDVSSSDKTVTNYCLQYNALKTKLHSFPSNRFVVWTGAALTYASTNPADAARAKKFFDWVKNVWDEKGDNIYVFDFYTLETGGTLYITAAHAESSGDSHPNAAFSAEVAPLFAQRVIDVLEGRGDTGSLTGED